jgi:hypothetical protein
VVVLSIVNHRVQLSENGQQVESLLNKSVSLGERGRCIFRAVKPGYDRSLPFPDLNVRAFDRYKRVA